MDLYQLIKFLHGDIFEEAPEELVPQHIPLRIMEGCHSIPAFWDLITYLRNYPLTEENIINTLNELPLRCGFYFLVNIEYLSSLLEFSTGETDKRRLYSTILSGFETYHSVRKTKDYSQIPLIEINLDIFTDERYIYRLPWEIIPLFYQLIDLTLMKQLPYVISQNSFTEQNEMIIILINNILVKIHSGPISYYTLQEAYDYLFSTLEKIIRVRKKLK